MEEAETSRTSRLTISALCTAVLVTLSLSTATPAVARDGGWMVHQSTIFMMNNGARLNMNTLKEARARQQLATAEADDRQRENPGWFIELISICDHLKDSGVTCE